LQKNNSHKQLIIIIMNNSQQLQERIEKIAKFTEKLNSGDTIAIGEGLQLLLDQLYQEASECHKVFKERFNSNQYEYQRNKYFYGSKETLYDKEKNVVARGVYDRRSTLVQYILRSPQMTELRRVPDRIIQLMKDSEFHSASILRVQLVKILHYILLYTVNIDQKDDWPSKFKSEYDTVRQSTHAIVNFVCVT
jgi:hypothetical protein